MTDGRIAHARGHVKFGKRNLIAIWPIAGYTAVTAIMLRWGYDIRSLLRGDATMSRRELQRILRSLRRELARVLGDQLQSVILYGSQARGQANSASDIDVLVVVRDDSDYADLIRRTSAVVSDLSLQHDVVISRAFVSNERFEEEQTPFLLNVRREGVPV